MDFRGRQSWSTFGIWNSPTSQSQGGWSRGRAVYSRVIGIPLKVASVLRAWPEELCVNLRRKKTEWLSSTLRNYVTVTWLPSLSPARAVVSQLPTFPLSWPRTLVFPRGKLKVTRRILPINSHSPRGTSWAENSRMSTPLPPEWESDTVSGCMIEFQVHLSSFIKPFVCRELWVCLKENFLVPKA